MLDRLGCGQQAGIERGRIGILFHDLLAFFDKALDGIALLAARGLAEQLEYLFQPFDVPLGLVVVLFERRPQLIRIRRLRHFRQRLQDLLFGIVDVLERIEK